MKFIVLYVFAILLYACAPGEESAAYWEPSISAEVREFVTLSGQQCIFVTDGNAGGLSCDWP